jgi:hypothetical protein
MAASYSVMRRRAASMSATAWSAVLDAFAPGVVQTATPRRVATSMSIESVPTPMRAITRREPALSSTSASNGSVETIAAATPSSRRIRSAGERSATFGASRRPHPAVVRRRPVPAPARS